MIGSTSSIGSSSVGGSKKAGKAKAKKAKKIQKPQQTTPKTDAFKPSQEISKDGLSINKTPASADLFSGLLSNFSVAK